jgi:ATP-dependent Lon protease
MTGGDILFFEATKMPGKKGFVLTGQLGDVMKESAQAALSYVRSRARELQIDPKFFEEVDMHLHIPAGSLPKDGPSAGVTMVTALASLLTGRAVKSNVGMTGEITLRGKVLPIGGLKEKVLAAARAGLDTVILPKRNEADLEDVPENVRNEMTFILVDTVDEVLGAALEETVTNVDDVVGIGEAKNGALAQPNSEADTEDTEPSVEKIEYASSAPGTE